VKRAKTILPIFVLAAIAAAWIATMMRIERARQAAANAHACAVAAHERLDAAGVPMNGGAK